jgi:hypothetical protein
VCVCTTLSAAPAGHSAPCLATPDPRSLDRNRLLICNIRKIGVWLLMGGSCMQHQAIETMQNQVIWRVALYAAPSHQDYGSCMQHQVIIN